MAAARRLAQPAVDARGVGVEDGAPLCDPSARRALRLGAEAVHADLAIERERARGPTSAASSPAARRRARSIWKKRSCACRNPVARATSSRVAPRMVGMPSVSRVTITGAESPSSRSSPVSGRLPRSSARAHTTLAAAPMASKIAMASPTFHSRRRIVLIMVMMRIRPLF